MRYSQVIVVALGTITTCGCGADATPAAPMGGPSPSDPQDVNANQPAATAGPTAPVASTVQPAGIGAGDPGPDMGNPAEGNPATGNPAAGNPAVGMGGGGSIDELGGGGMGNSGTGDVGALGGAPDSAATGGAGAASVADPFPLLAVLPRFTAADVPVRGPMEDVPEPIDFTGEVPDRPGDGLGQHPFLYVGENYNRISLVNEGRVIWTYDTQGGFELDDVWMLSNGNILYSHQTYVEEITPTKQVVWHYDVPPGSEIHTCQPLGLDRVLFGLNQDPTPRAMIINTTTNEVELDQLLPDGASASVHGQLRRMRFTASGTYLFAWLDKGLVVEYDQDFNPIWTYETPRPWSVARLRNGNTLIQDENEATCKEIDPQGELVWSLNKSEISVPGAQLNGNTQSCERLASGNTVMFNHSTSAGNLQAVEVTNDKQVVWALEDYQNLKDATSAQFLDEPGIPEVPGATEH